MRTDLNGSFWHPDARLAAREWGKWKDSGPSLLSVERVKSHLNVIAIMDLLITNTASPASSDFRNGLTFEVATRMGDKALIDRLFGNLPSATTINHAFPYIFELTADEKAHN